MITLAPTSFTAAKMSLAVPGTPVIPVLQKVTNFVLSIVANPLTGNTDLCPSSYSLSVDRQIIVPGAARLKIFFITIGMSYCITGTIVRGCNTFAPKYD
ncbi:bifunctional aspartokinasehomoserine dehydrogenase 1, chloroplastic, partial [Nicotiana attenuata]